MSKKSARSRSQTLSLRTSPLTRFALDKSSVYFRQSMTDVIERSVSLMMQAEVFDLPDWVKPIDGEKTITLQRVVNLTWSEDEVTRILRTAIVAPALLSSEEAHVAVVLFGIMPFKIGDKLKGHFWGAGDPFEGVDMADSYYKGWPKFNLEKCAEYLDVIRENSHLSNIDLGLAYRGKLGDIRGIRAIPSPV